MRLPLEDRSNVVSRPPAQTKSIPSPVKGWNTVDPIALMDPRFAVVLDDWIPRTLYCELRPGQANWNTGVSGTVETLMTYTSPTAKKLFAAIGSVIKDATTTGAIGANVQTGLTSARWQFVNYANSAGSWLLAVNGADDYRIFDGTTWTAVNGASSPALTGVTTSSLVDIIINKRRIWFVEKDSLNAWYLAAEAIAGAATKFALGPIFNLGGSLLAAGTWTIDAGAGSDDYIAFVTTEGEVAVYGGLDPTSSSTFGLIGVFRVPKPVGRRCLTKYGGDMLIITEQGVFPMSKAIQSATISYSDSLTYNIAPTFTESVNLAKAEFGWQTMLFSESNLLLVNIPPAAAPSKNLTYQYAMDTVTKGWCRFRSHEAKCWAVFDGKLIYGGVDKIVRAMNGVSDFGNDRRGQLITAYNGLSNRVRHKHISLIRPNLTVDEAFQGQLAVATDFDTEYDFQPGSLDTATGPAGVWDSTNWDECFWDFFGGSDIHSWRTVFAPPAYMVAAGLRINTKTANVKLNLFDLVYNEGGIL